MELFNRNSIRIIIKNMVAVCFCCLPVVFWGQTSAQQDSSILSQTHLLNTIEIDGQTIAHVNIPEVIVLPPPVFKNYREYRRYTRLMRNIKKVYPYAKVIKEIFSDVNNALDTIPEKRARKAYIKSREAELKQKFEQKLKKLTFSQGRLLIKLVDRETGHTTYEVVKELKGSFNAFFWQSIARIFGSNLKSEYDGSGDDWMIEDIIRRIECGQI